MEKEKTRINKIEDFLLNPDKVIFETMEELKNATEVLLPVLGKMNTEELTMLRGEDAETPERGVDYMSPEDLEAIEDFILERLPEEGVDFPSPIMVENYINARVAKMPNKVGDKGKPGKPGNPGEDGSPDTGAEILSKIRSLSKNQGLKMKDVRGLENKIKEFNDLLDEFEKLDNLVKNIQITYPINDDGTGGGLGDAPSDGQEYVRKDGAWIVATGGGATVETPTGTVNGSNVTFTVTATPQYIVADGITYFEGAGYSLSTLTVTMESPPVSYIRSFY